MILSGGSAVPTSIDTIGDRTPLFADASYYSTSMLPLSGIWAAYSAIYKTQVWVGVTVRKLGFGTARLPFEPKFMTDQGHEPERGPLADLLDQPNPRLNGFRLKLWTAHTFHIYGEAYWLKLRDQNKRVRELYPMHPTNTIVRRDKDDGRLKYKYAVGSANVSQLPEFDEADVVPFLNYNPDTMMRGLSNLEQLRQTLLNEDAARRAMDSFWRRGARPGVMISAPQGLSDKAYERIQSAVDRVHAGVDNAGGTLILEEGAEPKQVQLNAEEMQYIESRKLNREEVCAAYDIPPPVVHILDRATFSNITEQMRSLYRDTMPPQLGVYESTVAEHLTSDFYRYGDVECRFNLDDVLRGDFEARAKAAALMVENGILKPSEARVMFSLDDAGPVANKLYANAALQELGRPAERVTITANAPASEGEAADAAHAEQDAAQQQDDAARSRGTRTVVEYAKPTDPVRRGGRPPKSTSKETA